MPATISKSSKRNDARQKAEEQKAKRKQLRDTKMAVKNAPTKSKAKLGKRR